MALVEAEEPPSTSPLYKTKIRHPYSIRDFQKTLHLSVKLSKIVLIYKTKIHHLPALIFKPKILLLIQKLFTATLDTVARVALSSFLGFITGVAFAVALFAVWDVLDIEKLSTFEAGCKADSKSVQ